MIYGSLIATVTPILATLSTVASRDSGSFLFCFFSFERLEQGAIDRPADRWPPPVRIGEATDAPRCSDIVAAAWSRALEKHDIIRPHSERRSGAERGGGGGGGGVAWVTALPRRHWPGPAVMSHISKLLSRALNRPSEDEADGQKVASSEIKEEGRKTREKEGERERGRWAEDGKLAAPRRNVGRTAPEPRRLSLLQLSSQRQVVAQRDGDPLRFRALKVLTAPTWRRTRGAGSAAPSLSGLETRSCATLTCRVQVGAGPGRVVHAEPLRSFYFFFYFFSTTLVLGGDKWGRTPQQHGPPWKLIGPSASCHLSQM